MRFRERLIRAVAHVDASSPLASATLKACESSGEWPTSDFFDAKFGLGAGWCVARSWWSKNKGARADLFWS
jgi:hypothetical protein